MHFETKFCQRLGARLSEEFNQGNPLLDRSKSKHIFFSNIGTNKT